MQRIYKLLMVPITKDSSSFIENHEHGKKLLVVHAAVVVCVRAPFPEAESNPSHQIDLEPGPVLHSHSHDRPLRRPFDS